MLSENISTPIYVECNNMYRSKVCVQKFWYIVSGLDIQLENSEDDNPARKKSGSSLRKQRFIYPFFGKLRRIYGTVVKVGLNELGDMGSMAARCSVSALTRALLHCCTLYI